MKYRFSSLDQILHSPLFDFSVPYQRAERTDHCTRPTRLESMVFHDACNANGLDAAAPLLADLFHLLYAQACCWGKQSSLSPKGRFVWAHLLDGMQQDAQFAALHHLCQGNDSAAIQAAHTVQQALSAAVHEIDRTAGRLLLVLEKLERRHDKAEETLRRMIQEAQADPAKTPEAIRAAAEAASTAEQIQAVSAMIRDELRKQQAETADVLCRALQQGMDVALLMRSVQQCWGAGGSEHAAHKAAHDRELLERVRNNPMLLDITRQLGRMKEMLSDLRKNDYAHGRGEKYSITRGRDLKNLLSGELALLASPQRRRCSCANTMRRDCCNMPSVSASTRGMAISSSVWMNPLPRRAKTPRGARRWPWPCRTSVRMKGGSLRSSTSPEKMRYGQTVSCPVSIRRTICFPQPNISLTAGRILSSRSGKHYG